MRFLYVMVSARMSAFSGVQFTVRGGTVLQDSKLRIPPSCSIEAEPGRARIYETSTALTSANSTTLRCG